MFACPKKNTPLLRIIYIYMGWFTLGVYKDVRTDRKDRDISIFTEIQANSNL